MDLDLQIQHVGVTVKRDPVSLVPQAPALGVQDRAGVKGVRTTSVLGWGGSPCSPLVAGSGEALSWKAVVAVPTQTLFQAPLNPKVSLVLSRKTFREVRKGLTEDTGYEQPSVHPVLYCSSISLTYSFVKLPLFFV